MGCSPASTHSRTRHRPEDRASGGAGDPVPLRRPTGIAKAGRRNLTSIAAANAPRMSDKLVTAIMTALDEQTVVVPDTAAADTVLPRLVEISLSRSPAARTGRRRGRGGTRCAPSRRGPDLDARHRSQDRSPHPAGDRRHPELRLLRAPGRVRRHHPGHPQLRLLHQGRTPRLAPATANSNERSSSPRSPPCPTPPAGPTTSANATRERTTTPR